MSAGSSTTRATRNPHAPRRPARRLELALSRPRSPEELKESVRRALADVEGLSRLAEDLLVLSRTEGGRVPIHREEVRVSREPGRGRRGPVSSARRRARRRGLEVETADGSAHLDPVRVRQVIENLLDNSIRHTGAGGYVRVARSGRTATFGSGSTTPAKASR